MVEVAAVRNDGVVHAATFQKDAQVTLTVIQVPPQLRQLEFARTSPSGDIPLLHHAPFKYFHCSEMMVWI
jgi:hypothetical protein